jgi:YidC/Oxa1 family membrane protein insertase
MIAIWVWQQLLTGFGWVLAQIYDLVPNYALAIILLTLLIRVILLPFGIKQIKSMQHMQALQPKIKELQRRFKNNKQKQQEETMKLYREAGVNPLGGCLPLLLTFPFLIAMYAVLRPPVLEPTTSPAGQPAYVVVNNHLPEDSALFQNVVTHQKLDIAGASLQCSLATSGEQVQLKDTKGQPIQPGLQILGPGNEPLPFDAVSQATLDCGTSKFPDAIPYVLLIALMVGSGFYQQRQMTKANPPSAQTGPQQAVMKYMPLLFLVWGWQFPAGLVLYWTTSNGIQIGQQYILLRAGHIGPEAVERRIAEHRERAAQGGGTEKKGIMAWLNEKASAAQEQQDTVKKQRPAEPRPKPQGKRNQKAGNQKAGNSNQKAANEKRNTANSGNAKGGSAKPSPAPADGKANDHQPQADPTIDGKPTKGAQPGNQLRPRNKRKR